MNQLTTTLYLVLEIFIYLIDTTLSSSNTSTTYSPWDNLFSSTSCNGTGSRCGADWNDANDKCGGSCPCGVDRQCPNNEFCFSDLSTIPCYNETIDPLNITIPSVGSCGTKSLFPLAFDDGPWTTHNASLKIAKYLHNANISGTFFVSPAGMNGNNTIELQKKCDLIVNMLDYGHYVESHSWSHPDFDTLTYSEIINELELTSNFIHSCAKSGGYNSYYTTMFRPPYGRLNITQAKLIADLGYIIVLWNIDSEDYDNVNDFSGIASNLDDNMDLFANKSSISALMHDFGVFNIIGDIVDYVENDLGYTIVNSKECYEMCDTFDSYGICRDPNGLDWSTLEDWDEAIATLILNNETLESVINRFEGYNKVGEFDSTMVSNDSLLESTDNDENEDDSNSSDYENAINWAFKNMLYLIGIALLVGLVGLVCCVYVCGVCKICKISLEHCKDRDGFDEYFHEKHQTIVSPQDLSMHSQSQTA